MVMGGSFDRMLEIIAAARDGEMPRIDRPPVRAHRRRAGPTRCSISRERSLPGRLRSPPSVSSFSASRRTASRRWRAEPTVPVCALVLHPLAGCARTTGGIASAARERLVRSTSMRSSMRKGAGTRSGWAWRQARCVKPDHTRRRRGALHTDCRQTTGASLCEGPLDQTMRGLAGNKGGSMTPAGSTRTRRYR